MISKIQLEKIKTKIHEYVKKYGIEKCREIFGDKVLFTIGFNNDPMEYLNLFNDLEVAQCKNSTNWTLFRNKKGKNLMIYLKEKNEVNLCYKEIWSVLQNDFGLSYTETKQLTKEWVEITYNLKEFKIDWSSSHWIIQWEPLKIETQTYLSI
jgi:hypothetical protein